MKLTLALFFFVILGIFLWYIFIYDRDTSTSVVSTGACKRELTYAWTGVNEPFVMGDPLSPYGTDVEILNEALATIGCKATIKNTKEVSWKRNLSLLSIGDIDIVLQASRSSQREGYAFFSSPYRSEYVAIFVREEDLSNNKFPIKDINDISKYSFKLAVGLGNIYGNKIDSLINKLGSNAKKEKKVENSRRMLKTKLIDGYLAYIPTEPLELKAKGIEDNIKILPNSIEETGEIYFMLSKDSTNQNLVELINNGIQKIKSNGVYKNIISKYQEKYSFPVLK